MLFLVYLLQLLPHFECIVFDFTVSGTLTCGTLTFDNFSLVFLNYLVCLILDIVILLPFLLL